MSFRLRRCVSCKRRYASLSGETNYCPTCRSLSPNERPNTINNDNPQNTAEVQVTNRFLHVPQSDEIATNNIPCYSKVHEEEGKISGSKDCDDQQACRITELVRVPSGSEGDTDCCLQEGTMACRTIDKTQIIDLCSSPRQNEDPSISAITNDESIIPLEEPKPKRPKLTSSNITTDLQGTTIDDAHHPAIERSISSQIQCHDAEEPSSSMLDPSYKCAICCSSLQHVVTVQGRLHHLKRCSKKYGVQARDLGSSVGIVASPTKVMQSSSSAEERPEEVPAGSDDPWHTGAHQDLQLAGGALNLHDVSPSESNSNQPQLLEKRQSAITNFFQKPIRSVNNVLLAGAKRLASCNQISRQTETASTSIVNNYGKRRFPTRNNSRQGISKDYCPKYKRITGTDFICDGFHYASPKVSTKYFLSHFHSDHYGGITSSWNIGTIYCSLATANLVHQQLGVDKKFLHPLGLMTPTFVESRGKPVTVTLLDANHCPGAVMFLFQVGNKTILHVGDFRWDREIMLQQPPLQSFFHLTVRLDEIFLDTTYCDEKYAGIPTQQRAIDATIEAVDKELAECSRLQLKPLLLFGSYTIGKEKIYLSICEHLKMKAFVDKRRYKILAALNWPPERMRLLTTDKSETCIWIVPLGHINFKQMPSYQAGNAGKVFSKGYDRIIGFRPTGWTFNGNSKGLVTKRTSGPLTIYGVPYSEHSNFSELVDCLHCLKPKKIIPTVSVSKGDEHVDLLLRSVQRIQV